jgi:serine/threonine-protein kinase
VETFDAGIDAETGAPFLVMELLKGEELAALLERRGRLPAAEALDLLGQAALALDRTHEAGIIHRDLKPENLFVTRRDDGSPFLKILDFGVAKLRAQSSQSIKTTRSLGTPLYMPPEQIEGSGAIDHRADLYSLAHIAYTMLVGEAYWEPESRNTDSVYPILVKVMAGMKEQASVRAARCEVTLPLAFDAWFAKGTALAPDGRFDTASALVAELAAALGETEPRGRPASRPDPPEPRSVGPETPGPRAPATNLSASMDRDAATLPTLGGTRRVVAGVAVLVTGCALALVLAWQKHADPRPPQPGSAPASPAATPLQAAPASPPSIVAPASQASAPAITVTPADPAAVASSARTAAKPAVSARTLAAPAPAAPPAHRPTSTPTAAPAATDPTDTR